MQKPGKLTRLVKEVYPGCNVHYLSDGYFSMHDLVISLIKKYAPADLTFTTYALRELPVRQLVMCKQEGLIKNLNALLDYRAQVNSAEVNEFAKQNFTSLVSRPIHAKVCVIKSAEISITIVGSSNWTLNPKVEAGTICGDPSIAEFHLSWINKMMNHEPVFI